MTDPAKANAKLERELQSVKSELQRVRSELRTVKQEHTTLKRKTGEVEKQNEKTGQELRTAQERLAAQVRADVAGVDAALHRVEETVDWLEERLHAQLSIEPADLGTTDSGLRRLAEQARRGRDAEARLLDAATRRKLQDTIDAATRLAERIDGHEQAALRWSEALAASEPGDRRYREALAAYRSTTDALAEDRRSRLPEDAAGARRSLATDAALRDQQRTPIADGQAAARQLQERLRERLSQAVTEVGHLPAWLRWTMGRRPTGHPEWMDTATSLLAYRVTYGVTDEAVALGRPQFEDPRRQAWHDDLEKRLRDATSRPAPPAPTSRPDRPSG